MKYRIVKTDNDVDIKDAYFIIIIHEFRTDIIEFVIIVIRHFIVIQIHKF